MARTKYQWTKGRKDIQIGYFGAGTEKKWTLEHNVGRKSTKQTIHNTLKEAFQEARKSRKGTGWKGYGFLG